MASVIKNVRPDYLVMILPRRRCVFQESNRPSYSHVLQAPEARNAADKFSANPTERRYHWQRISLHARLPRAKSNQFPVHKSVYA